MKLVFLCRTKPISIIQKLGSNSDIKLGTYSKLNVYLKCFISLIDIQDYN